MHLFNVLLLSILLLGLNGCEEKTSDDTAIPVEDTTEVLSLPQDAPRCDNKFKVTQTQQVHDDTVSPPDPSSVKMPEVITGTNTFILLNTKSKSRKITFSDEKVIFHNNDKPIVLINLFATWCPPCKAELPYLNLLQKKYGDDLSLLGVLTHDTMDVASIKSFIAKNEIHYFISSSPHNNAFSTRLANSLQLPQNFSIPLTVLYVNGTYFTHYEGIVPVEMIEYDIQQAQKQLKLKSK